MELTFHGAAGGVTGSRTLVRGGASRALVDCGMFQGVKAMRLLNRAPFPFDPPGLDAVVLTHAHLDHSGMVPALVKAGFEGPVYCTPSTARLLELLWPDSGHIMEEDAEHANRKRYSKHDPARPIYTQAEAVEALKQVRPIRGPVDIGNLRVEWSPAGHILGASSVRLSSEGASVLFSGDVGRPTDILMKPPAPPLPADVFVCESTYGDRLHAESDPVTAMGEVVRRTAERGGITLVPSFAVGRAQALIYALWLLRERGAIPADLPVYLNSPMALDATDVLLAHADEHRLSAAEARAVFGSVRRVRSVDESRELGARREPAVILAAAGMLTGGRVLHHLRALAPDRDNTVLFVGYQAAGSRGALILGGARDVKMHGQRVPIRCEVAQVDGFSAHADAAELVAWLGSSPERPRRVLLNHGEPAAADGLRQRIGEALGWPASVVSMDERVIIPGGKGEPTSVRVPRREPAPTPPESGEPPLEPAPVREIEDIIVVCGGAQLTTPERAAAARDEAREAFAASEDEQTLWALEVAERRALNSHYHDQARRLTALATEVPYDGHRTARVVTAGGLRDAEAAGNARALVAFPGAFDTLATVFDLLRQGDGVPHIPLVLVGRDFWRRVIDLDVLAEEGLVTREALARVNFADSAAESWAAIRHFYGAR